MPSGAAIFQTIGPWEDYSTPSRDMRLIIAINVLNGLPRRSCATRIVLDERQEPREAKAKIKRYHARLIQEHSIHYTRTDGSLLETFRSRGAGRKSAYEMLIIPTTARNTLGAKPGTEEYSTCRRHAPREQRVKMERYRIWFRETRRPAQ